MSEIKVNSIKGVSASVAALSINNTDGTCTANITNNLSNRNLVINGAFQIAQRGTSSTTSGFGSVDRFHCQFNGADEAMTHTQHTLTSSDTGPYAQGFRKSFHVQNGNQTSGAGATDWMRVWYKFEAQDIANSGWDYTSPSSYLTLSFWVKASVAQTYYVQLATQDGTSQMYYFAMTLSANTWTKVTHSIPGHADLTFDNDNGEGLYIAWYAFRGTNNTGTVTANQWNTFSGSTLTPDQTTTWWTTNDSTYEVTGVQLEVGSVATDFEHRSFGQELKLCERYYLVLVKGPGKYFQGVACNYMTNFIFMPLTFKTEMRTTPTLIFTEGSGYYQLYDSGNTSGINFNRPSTFDYSNSQGGSLTIGSSHISGATNGNASLWYAANAAALLAFNAEL